jgi:fructan beta-fructosidase
MKTTSFTFAALLFAASLMMASCGGDDNHGQDYNPLIDDPQPEQPKDEEPVAKSGYDEQFRPQVHYTPAKNWVNDPNGLVYDNGTYHLFYQYNPQGNDWGNMSWGHATSSDLIHWTEQAVALTRDALGAVFSGSCVIDKDNTAGFGAGAMVALYTAAGETGDVAGKQQQCIAYSTDGGKNFTRFASNPVIKNDDDNLRDPKVFWHQASKKWIMALAKGWKMGVEFYGSTDLKSWQHLSTFVTKLNGRPSLQWECPDLIQMGDKWVLVVSVNPGGPILGSGMMYFTGQFDGTTFTADAGDYPVWFDYGMDNYAGVTWSGTGDRRIMIGWMNNWQYSGNVPCSPWRSAFTLPRELKLIEVDGKTLLGNTVVKEIDGIAGQWQTITGDFEAGDAYQLRLTLGLDKDSKVTLSNNNDEQFEFNINATARTLSVRRNYLTGQTSFNGTFSVPSIQAPLNVTGNTVTLDLFVDQSSVELFTQSGSMAMTNLVFPKSIYNHLSVSGATSEAQVRKLNSIWK